MTDEKEKKTNANKLTQASREIGKALARSSFKAERTGKQITKKMKNAVTSMATNSPFNAEKDVSIIESMGFVAGEICFNNRFSGISIVSSQIS